jgi:hypothetical protein
MGVNNTSLVEYSKSIRAFPKIKIDLTLTTEI